MKTPEEQLAAWYAKNRETAKPARLVRYDRLLSGKCDYPGCEEPGSLRRQNTQYLDDISNFGSWCEPHQVEVDEIWAEQWAEYYASVMP